MENELQQQLHNLVSYLNTPHYYLAEDMKHHDLWKDVLKYYNHGSLEKDDPFGLFSIVKALKLSKGVEPVLFYRYFYNDSKKKILTSYKWKQGKWTIKNKLMAYVKLKISKSS